MHEDRIIGRRAGMTGLGGRPWFLLSLWLSLATAILCAVLPAGLPLTRTIGSAFDPSTTIVALRARPPAPTKAVLLRIGDADGADIGSGPATLARLARVTVTPLAISMPAAILVPRILSPVPRALPVALYARPPPLA